MNELPSDPVARLLTIMERLRDPERGCPWDREQTFRTLAHYTLEEAYEVADSIERGELDELRDELGDLLFQVVFYAEMAREQGAFDFHQVAEAICAKMIRRHPHVFGDAVVADVEAQRQAWEALKAGERHAKSAALGAPPSRLDGVALALPALVRAHKLQRRAAEVGFDWREPLEVLAKVQEETAELAQEIAAASGQGRLEDELGDLLFAAVNLARHLGVDAEAALRGANAKFERRFKGVEQGLRAQGKAPEEASLAEMDALWEAVKRAGG
jgi:nucleoside triphosphate diphosphatase